MRVPTGVKGFDNMIGGGLIAGRTYIVSGPPGGGKTTFCVQFLLKGALQGENGMYISFSEPVNSLIQDMESSYKFPLREYISRNFLFFVDMAPFDEHVVAGDERVKKFLLKALEMYMPKAEAADQYISPMDLFSFLKKVTGPLKIKRLVIDSMMGLRAMIPEAREKEIIKFMRGLKTLGITTLIISEMYETLRYQPEHFIAHGLIVFHHFMHEGSMIRGVQVLKMRGTKHEEDIREVVFTSRGLEVTERVVRI